MAGTYSANTIAVAAANATMDELARPGAYDAVDARSQALVEGLTRILKNARLPAFVVAVGPVLQVWFSKHPIRNYRDAARHADHALFRKWWEGMLDRGVLFHPGAYQNLFVSFAHTDDDIEATLAAAREVAAMLAR
jgi:glutamate-1-semialdehyde 2,1-aminomutase